MTLARPPRRGADAVGPAPATHADIGELNRVFSDAFTERYRKDGMTGVRVPQLNPVIWRYAMDDADGGALVWRNEHGAFKSVEELDAVDGVGPKMLGALLPLVTV